MGQYLWNGAGGKSVNLDTNLHLPFMFFVLHKDLTAVISDGSSPSTTISTLALPFLSVSRIAVAKSRALLRSRMFDFSPYQVKIF